MKKLLIFLMILIPLVVIFIVNVTVDIVAGVVTISVDNVVLDYDSHIANINDSFKLNAQIEPEGASDKTIIWSSSDESIATVDEEGNVTFHAFGAVDITATSGDGLKKDSCHINVTDTRVHDITIYADKTTLTLGESVHILASVIPNTADNQEYILRSSNEDVVSINASGMATGKSTGNAIITATSLDGNYEASLSLEVIIPVLSIDIIPEEEQITIGSSSILLSYNITPLDATNKKVIFTSSDPSTATVDTTGRVNFIKTGEVVITATTENGNFTDSIKIKYTGGYPLSINLEQKEANFDISNGALDMKINYSVSPADTNILNVYFSSNNINVATVNQNGLVQMIGGGTATISIKVQTGENTFIYDSVLINVKQNIKEIVFPKENIISATNKVVLSPNLIPTDATERDNIVFEIISGNCANLLNNGELSFNSAGSVTVKAYLKDNPSIFDETTIVYTGGYPYSVEKVESKIEINDGENGSLNFILNPTGVSIRDYIFKIIENTPSQAGNNVISIDEASGRFTALSGGKAIVRLYVKSGENAEITTDYEIIVNRSAEEIVFDIDEEIYNSIYVTGNNVVNFVANTLPQDTTEKEIIYSISNDEIAKIIDNKIHFNQAGKLTLTATLKTNKNISKSVEIWYTGGYAISAKVVGLPNQFVAGSSSFDISLTDIVPKNATNKSFSVVFSNEQAVNGPLMSVLYNANSTVATVNQLNSGSLTLSVVLAGSSSAIYSQNVEILQKIEKIEFITHGGETPNTQIELLCQVLPINASVKDVVFSLAEPYASLAKIENNKLIFNASVNEKETVVVLAKLTDIDGSVVEASLEITTTFGKISAPEGNEITLSPSNMVEYDYSSEILTGYKLSYKILSGNDLINIGLNNNKIQISAITIGKANVEVQLIDENTNALFKILANLQITIAEKITNINIESDDLNLVNNKYYTGINEFQLNIILEPENANLENVNVKISDDNVATYDKTTGVFKFLKTGIVELTISSNDGSISKKFVLQNTNGSSISSEINLNNSNNNLAINSKIEVKLVSFIPANIDLKISSITEIKQSGNKNILEIVKDGEQFLVKGIEAGRTNIQVSLSDGTTKTFQITVVSSITNISFNNAEITTANKTYTLNPILTPANPSNKSLIFESNNTEIATVNNFGVVSFNKKGSVVITVRSEENPEISTSITINSTFGEISDFTLNFSTLQLMTGEVRLLSVNSIFPTDASCPTFKFEVLYMNSNNDSNLDVVSLNNGSITALNGGIAVIKVYTTLENGEEVVKTCEITVERPLTMVDVELLSKLDLYQNYYVTSLEEIEFKLITSPIDATISNSKISIDDEDIAEIQGNKVVFKNEGLIKLTVQVNNSIKSLTIRHTKTPISFELDGIGGTVSNNVRTVELNAGSKLIVKAKNVIPSDIFDQSISLQLVVSSPNSIGDIVCQVNENVITATHGGSAKYKVIVAGKESNEILQVVVIQKATKIEVQNEITTSKQIYSLNAKLLPADATSPLLTYSIISGAEIATIDGLGIITFKNEGEIIVKIRNEYSNIEATSKITYSLGARTIEFDAAPDFVFIGKTLQFSIIISPTTIVNEPVVWSVLKADGTTAGATISQSGLLTPSKFEETVIVTVSLLNYPGVNAVITIEIVAIITDINMDEDASNDKVGIAEEKVFGTHNVSYSIVDGKEVMDFTNTFQLGFNLIHNCATMPELTYISSNEQVATIDANGLVTVHSPGKTTISIYPKRQINTDSAKYIYDSYTFNFVSGINLYNYKDFINWVGISNDGDAATAFKLGGVLQDTVYSPSMSPSVGLCENKTLHGNGNLINLNNVGKSNEADNRTIYIKSNTTLRNVQIRAYAFKKDETILNLNGTFSCVIAEANSKNVNLEYSIFENAQVNVRIHNSEVNLKGCIIANSYNGGLLCDSENGNRTPNIVNIDSCIFENNMLGCITNMTLAADKAETVSVINLNGFVDFYNWQPVSLLSEIDFGELDNAFYRVIESLIQEKLSTILANHGYMFKTYNNDKYMHLGIVFLECDVQFEGLGIVLKNNGKVNFNTQNNPYALQIINEPIAVGTITFHAYGLSGSSNNSIQPDVSYKDNIKAVYDKIRRYTQG